MLRNYQDTRVVGLTLSQIQADYIRAKGEQPDYVFGSDRFVLVQDDFNTVDFGRRFDTVVSIGVFEHITNMALALERIRAFLREEGSCLLHFIVHRPLPGCSDNPRADPFLDRFIFPSARIWGFNEISRHTRHLTLTQQWYMNRGNYRRTIEAWLENFTLRREEVARKTGLPERTLRLWELYLSACIAVFQVQGGRIFGNGQYLLHPN